MSYWTGKVAVVTGGSAGFGRVLARSLIQAGAAVAIADRDSGTLGEAVDEFTSSGYQAAGFLTDVTRQDQVVSLFARTMDRFGRLDLLANIVGRSARGLALETTPEEFRDLIDLNFLSMVRCTAAAGPYLIQSKGHLVNMGSLAAKTASPYLGAYPASKFPVAAYSQQLRYELGPRGVHVLLVCPGPLARDDAGQRYHEQARGLPEAARRPGGGVKLRGIPPEKLAAKLLRACQRRKPELVVPAKAKLLFAFAQLWPSLGDWVIEKMTSRS